MWYYIYIWLRAKTSCLETGNMLSAGGGVRRGFRRGGSASAGFRQGGVRQRKGPPGGGPPTKWGPPRGVRHVAKGSAGDATPPHCLASVSTCVRKNVCKFVRTYVRTHLRKCVRTYALSDVVRGTIGRGSAGGGPPGSDQPLITQTASGR